MHYWISGVSTLRSFSCLCFSSITVFFHMFVCLPAVFHLKPCRSCDSSHPQGGLSLHHEPWGLNEHLTWWSSWLLQTHVSFPGCCGTNDHSHTALITKSLLGLGGNKAGFLPAVSMFLVIARRSYSSNNFTCVVLVGWLSSIFAVQIVGGGNFPFTCSQLALPPQSQNY